MAEFGLIGKDIDYSFSKSHFGEKFKNEGLKHTYENFDIDSIDKFPEIISSTKRLRGLNVTIPYKEAVIPYLTRLHKTAKKIGAVNTIKITKKGKLIGYNTDYFGFKKSIEPHLKSHHKKALILGTGGASKAIVYALKKLGIDYKYVSRKAAGNHVFTYVTLTENDIKSYQIIINCTPLGTYPKTNECPDIPYDAIDKTHLVFDLIYNPEESKFLTIAKLKGATICNGSKMLELQAEKAWRIWQKC
ncbi:shikimate dehydrogenase [Flavobacteriaceae bacterium S0825]|uniref:shikimate dehydrogenase family protein n=1 Tax=Gaetbulibacter sp. S0825 TaxID=2720084 RepID=UPI00143068A0|nr:shikimate dehydrogenase [Gaetbulibacter sp. S0825]MCK0110127.1 shikimate dehydrogenase [Flavobacteriaceae bacterium S0825]NIX65756.1 shikimate dehydrogenase [Gaetbulibacter sp. S0825]